MVYAQFPCSADLDEFNSEAGDSDKWGYEKGPWTDLRNADEGQDTSDLIVVPINGDSAGQTFANATWSTVLDIRSLSHQSSLHLTYFPKETFPPLAFICSRYRRRLAVTQKLQ
ncbi:hypothetical protein JOB18_027615 [Solea senegalensis]|uniref:Uncharacterized protein n=1 Tax=Solea senegalensis TaxID=28829 RepID=A0AAV6PV75_SOLSE|nr:hypothetical protein JOB18_027615 [Solea senegalensis]